MLGSQLTTAYLDASEDTRARRGLAESQDIPDRNVVKGAWGAGKIASIAHEVIGNDGPRLELERWLFVGEKGAALRGTTFGWRHAAPQEV
ncbi:MULTISPECIES: hypothetical protein [Streptomyces]|uniref:hypothetical protein n=1 Tax=Streptomyces TaxID=1883 RepID=UPI0023B001F4|nr:hypothetical protein [Streptomyces sp. KA12]MDF0371377.1 hypothetical protein [Streptomyces sp. KA12]